MSDLYFNEESDCFNEYTYDNEVFWSTISSYHPVFMGICPTISYMC